MGINVSIHTPDLRAIRDRLVSKSNRKDFLLILGQEIMRTILARTHKGREIGGRAFEQYEEAYSKWKAGKAGSR